MRLSQTRKTPVQERKKKIQHKTSINPKPKHMQVETAYTKSRTRTWHPYMNVLVSSVISQHSPHKEQHDCHFVLKLLLYIRDASNFRKWTVCSVQWWSQLLKRGEKRKRKQSQNGRICQNILALCTCSRRKNVCTFWEWTTSGWLQEIVAKSHSEVRQLLVFIYTICYCFKCLTRVRTPPTQLKWY